MVDVNRPKDGDNLSESGKGAGKIDHVARENQVGKVDHAAGKPTEKVLKGVPSDDQLLGKTDSKKAEEQQLAKADLKVDPQTGRVEELKSAEQVRKVAQTGNEERVRTDREAALKAAVDSGDPATITRVLEMNNRESTLWQKAHSEIVAQLQKSQTQLTNNA